VLQWQNVVKLNFNVEKNSTVHIDAFVCPGGAVAQVTRLACVAARLRRSGFNSRLRRLVGTCRSTKCIFCLFLDYKHCKYLRQAQRVCMYPLKSV